LGRTVGVVDTLAYRFVTLAVVLLGAAACAGTDSASPAGTPSSRPDQSSAGQPDTEESNVTTIRITADNRPIDAHLTDNPTAQDLADQLPLTLTFRDFNGVEKIAELPGSLTMDGVPEGDDPEIADIGYYAPSNNLVLYYGDVGYWKGIVRIGRFNSDDVDFIKGQSDGFQITVERAH
ncbi:MAG TPA: cyclophilin-like fold protein, partial [Mycobacterium sp.]